MDESFETKYIPTENFRTYCKRYHFKHAGLFGFQDGYFMLTKSYGLDAETVIYSQSTRDFWDGTIAKMGNWSHFSSEEKNLNQFYQFFSLNFRDTLRDLHYVKFATEDDTFVFFVAELEGETAVDLQSIDLFTLSLQVLKTSTSPKFDPSKVDAGLKFQKCNLYTLNIHQALNNYFENFDILNPVVKDDIYSTIFNQIYDSLSMSISGRNIVSSPDRKFIRAAIFSGSKISESLLFRQISIKTNKVLPEEYFEGACVKFIKQTTSAEEINSFLLGQD